MSTEPGSAGSRRTARASGDAAPADAARGRFRRTSAITLVVLAVAAVGLGFASVAQGPRLQTAQFDPQSAVALAGERLIMQPDQPVDAVTAGQVHVSPATPVQVTSTAQQVAVTFTGALDYSTQYTVTVDGATSASTGIGGSLEYSFTTPGVDVFALDRAAGGADAGTGTTDGAGDAVVGAPIGAPSHTSPVLQNAKIDQYATTSTTLAAVVLGDGGATSLVSMPLGASGTTTVVTPPGGTIDHLLSSPTSGLFGFTVDGGTDAQGQAYRGALFLYDPASSAAPKPIAGVGGAALSVYDWTFVPGTSSLIAQGTDEQLYLVAGTGSAPPTPLGRHAEMDGFVRGTTQLVVTDPEGMSTIDLSTGTVTPLALPPAAVSPALYPGEQILLGGGAYIQQFNEVDRTGPTPVVSSALALVDASGTHDLYGAPTKGVRINDYCLSPNGQYLAIESIPDTGVRDQYPLAGYSGTVTYLFDLTTRTTTGSIAGSQPNWCR